MLTPFRSLGVVSVWRHTTTETSGKAVIGRSTLIVGVLIAWLLSAAIPAYAHAALVGSDPADGATLTSPPTLITLTFNEPIDGDFSQVVVLDSAGGHRESGKPHVDGGQVHQEVGPLEVGSFKVSYRVVSADGHPVEGTLAFQVTGSAPTSTPGPGLPTESTATAKPAPTKADDVKPASATSGVPMWLVASTAALLVLAALAAGVAIRRRRTGTH